MRYVRYIFLFLVLSGLSASQTTDQNVRSAIEGRYQELARANERRDLAAVIAIRHETFHAVGPDGRILGPSEMRDYSKQFFATNEPPITVKFTVRDLKVSGDGMVAAAEVFQEVTRFRQIEGQRRKVETSAEQRETWIKTDQAWKLKSVDNVRNQTRRVETGEGRAQQKDRPREALTGVSVRYSDMVSGLHRMERG